MIAHVKLLCVVREEKTESNLAEAETHVQKKKHVSECSAQRVDGHESTATEAVR